MSDRTGIGRVALRVADLDRMVQFYERVVGLETLDRTADQAMLGVDDPCLVLLAAPDARPRKPTETGLFHTAFRVPSRAALGDALDRITSRWRLDGASDHRVSEALYLTDPEDNGVEVYRDRPRSAWPVEDDRVRMDTLSLALDPLRDAARGDERCPAGTAVGHVHLDVASLSAARGFYAADLSLRVRQSMDGACFLAVGDYHHHVAVNTWRGRERPPTDETRGLAWFELVLDGVTERTVTDPDGLTVRLRRP